MIFWDICGTHSDLDGLCKGRARQLKLYGSYDEYWTTHRRACSYIGTEFINDLASILKKKRTRVDEENKGTFRLYSRNLKPP